MWFFRFAKKCFLPPKRDGINWIRKPKYCRKSSKKQKKEVKKIGSRKRNKAAESKRPEGKQYPGRMNLNFKLCGRVPFRFVFHLSFCVFFCTDEIFYLTNNFFCLFVCLLNFKNYISMINFKILVLIIEFVVTFFCLCCKNWHVYVVWSCCKCEMLTNLAPPTPSCACVALCTLHPATLVPVLGKQTNTCAAADAWWFDGAGKEAWCFGVHADGCIFGFLSITKCLGQKSKSNY